MMFLLTLWPEVKRIVEVEVHYYVEAYARDYKDLEEYMRSAAGRGHWKQFNFALRFFFLPRIEMSPRLLDPDFLQAAESSRARIKLLHSLPASAYLSYFQSKFVFIWKV
jgi:hypothetical protein